MKFNEQLYIMGRREGSVLGYRISNLGKWVNGGISHQDEEL